MSAIWLIAVPALPVAAAFILIAARRLSFAAGRIVVAANAASLLILAALHNQIPMAIATQPTRVAGYRLTLSLWLDPLSFTTALFVAMLALLVNLYACGYMPGDGTRRRFFAAMAFFTGAMQTLVLAGSFLVLFAAWEWVGLASFLLIGFRYRREGVPAAAKNAFLITRVGDMGLLLGWLWLLLLFDTTDIATVLETVGQGAIEPGVQTTVGLLFVMGAAGKSAQLPLSAWLPPAMHGPTPVSALIHSATMVAAGVFLLLRIYPLLATVPMILDIVFWIGAVTALFAALAATMQADLKRVLAWSTISQLGEMFFSIGLAGPLGALFHLVVHGFFKATLFLTAGAIEHRTGSRELKSLGGLLPKMPVVGAVFVVAALALVGLPPFSGFFSEEEILAAAVEHGFSTGAFMLAMVFLAAVYISRAGAAVFGRWPGAPQPTAAGPDRAMQAAMIVSAILAAGLGWLLAERISDWVQFEHQAAELSISWRLAAPATALAGLGLGMLRVYRHGPVPALGAFWFWLEPGLNRMTQFFGRATLLLGHGVSFFEGMLAGGAIAARQATVSAAAGCSRMEHTLDRAALGLTSGCMALADRSRDFENRGFANGIDRLAGFFGWSGRQLTFLQTGKLYLYTLGLFVWILLVMVLGWVIWAGIAID